MEDIKSIVAKNITELRQSKNMTQLELAEKLNYSDKTISKWERAESSPDISVLVQLAELFGVTLDYFVKEVHTEDEVAQKNEKPRYNRKAILYISESVCWIVALFAFVVATMIMHKISFQYLFLVYTLPIVMIVRLVFNSVWFNPRHNYVIISFLMWSILASVHITFLYFGINAALIYLLGAAGQIVIILWSCIKKSR